MGGKGGRIVKKNPPCVLGFLKKAPRGGGGGGGGGGVESVSNYDTQ